MAEALAMAYPAALQNINRRGGKYFRCTFHRKTPGRNGEPVGSIREMVCRRHVRRYENARTGLGFYSILPEVRAAEDQRCHVMTVWDVEVFHQLRRQGLSLVQAGRQSYRRINMNTVIEILPLE